MSEKEFYLKILEDGGKSPNTIKTYKKDLNKLYSHFNISSVEGIKALTVEDFHSFYSAQNFKKNTSLNGLIRSLLSFFNWLVQVGHITEQHSFYKVRFGKSRFADVKKEKKVVLNPEEEKLLISAGRNMQEKFMLALMLGTVLRREAITNIKMSDIHNCRIKVTEKGDEEFYTYMDDTLCHMLNLYLLERDTDSEYLFYPVRGVEDGGNTKLSGTSINNRVRSAAMRSGIDPEKAQKITAHRLRGTGITRLIRTHGIDIAKRVANHKSTGTTAIYDETGDELVRKALTGE